jgi:hypothetical protein
LSEVNFFEHDFFLFGLEEWISEDLHDLVCGGLEIHHFLFLIWS